MSSELSKLRIEKQRWNAPREGGNRNPNYYGRNNVPQILQRDRKNNEDQKIQPPFQNNFVNEQDEAEDPDENLENNVFKEENDISFLTFDEYEYSLMA